MNKKKRNNKKKFKKSNMEPEKKESDNLDHMEIETMSYMKKEDSDGWTIIMKNDL